MRATALLRPVLPHAERLRGFLRHGAQSAAVGACIAVGFVVLAGHPPVHSLVYSESIAIGCWLCIDGSRLLVARWLHRNAKGGSDAEAGWPGWRWMLVCLLAGTASGVGLGLALGGWLTGGSQPAPRTGAASALALTLVVSFLAGAAITYVFSTRERLRRAQIDAELARRQAAEHRLRLLESQLEPHMLFNTLANLRALMAVDMPRAQLMLDRLIAFLRATLGASLATLQPLAAEFARIGDYLALMQVRMGDRLQIELQLPDALANEPVPPLLLQPLVENAIRHGLEPHVGGGRLIVGASAERDRLLLSVRDTGIGLTIDPSNADGFGLRQVRERLATAYGASASLELRPAEDGDGGTVATLRLPRSQARR